MPTLNCPTCHARVPYVFPDEVPCRPFCSERCKLIDLGRWLNEEYRIREEVPDADVTPPPGPPEEPSADK